MSDAGMDLLEQLMQEVENRTLTPSIVKVLSKKVPQGKPKDFYEGMALGMMLWDQIGQGREEEGVKRGAQGLIGLYVSKLLREASEEWPKEVDCGRGE